MNMGGIFFWIIVVVWVVLAVSKNAGKNVEKNTRQNVGNGRPAGTVQNRTGQSTNPQGDILQRAKASVEDDFSRNGYNSNGTSGNGTSLESKASNKEVADRRTSGSASKPTIDKTDSGNANYADAESRQKDIERLVAEKLAVAERVETEKYQQNHVLQTVEELMVKGPDTSLAFERDFLAEGMDMLNRIQG